MHSERSWAQWLTATSVDSGLKILQLRCKHVAMVKVCCNCNCECGGGGGSSSSSSSSSVFNVESAFTMDSPHFSVVEYQRYLLHFSAHCLMLLSVGVGGGGGVCRFFWVVWLGVGGGGGALAGYVASCFISMPIVSVSLELESFICPDAAQYMMTVKIHVFG